MPDASASGEEAGLPRGTVTFLFTDIEGSTELLRSLGTGYGEVRTEHGRLIEDACTASGGHVIDTQGAVLHLVLLLSEAEPGQILVSHSTEALLEGERLEPLQLNDLGERQLPRFDTPHRVFELVG